MDRYDLALGLAGVIGSCGTIAHGVLMQRLMVEPLNELAAGRLSATIRRLVPGLLHFTTFAWVVGGLALIIAAVALKREARMATGLLVGSFYLYATLGNLWATRGRHPGWVVYGLALVLLAYGLTKPRVECGAAHDSGARAVIRSARC